MSYTYTAKGVATTLELERNVHHELKLRPQTLAGLDEAEWQALAQRISTGLATSDDARAVQAAGLLPQAMRIRQGLATVTDATLVHLQVQLRLHGFHADMTAMERAG